MRRNALKLHELSALWRIGYWETRITSTKHFCGDPTKFLNPSRLLNTHANSESASAKLHHSMSANGLLLLIDHQNLAKWRQFAPRETVWRREYSYVSSLQLAHSVRRDALFELERTGSGITVAANPGLPRRSEPQQFHWENSKSAPLRSPWSLLCKARQIAAQKYSHSFDMILSSAFVCHCAC